LVAADARRFVRIGDGRYDVIVADNFHPARSGSGSLYTVEHFEAVRLRLNAHGIFVQWLPLHQLDLPTLRSIVQSFLRVFPDGNALLASNSLQTPVVGLLGRADDGRWDIAAVQSRVVGAAPASLIRSAGIEDAFALLGNFIADADALRRFAGTAPANTDDLPVVAYAAPRITYAEDSLPAERLLSLLRSLRIDPTRILSDDNPALRLRLAAYWAARDRFVESGRGVRPVPDAAAMLQQVREPLLGVLRISADFRPAYDPLLMMAQSLGAGDPVRARELLVQLSQLSPERLEAPAALRQLDSASR
jgi:spermidine synthase